MHRIAIQAVLLSLLGGALSAQQIRPAFVRWEPDARSTVGTAPDNAQQSSWNRFHQDDYRYEGLIFGGVALGALGAWAGSQISGGCPLDAGGDCGTDQLGASIALGLTGAVVGGGLGYLIGRASPKRPPAPPVIPQEPFQVSIGVPDSVRMRVGYQHWKGAAIGTGVGAVLGGMLALVADEGCSDCNTTTDDRVKAALVVTAGGGVLGFLAGLATPKYAWVQPGAAGEVRSDFNQE
jgi:hypothetical protein